MNSILNLTLHRCQMLQYIDSIPAPGCFSAQDVADNCQVSRATVGRFIKALVDTGILHRIDLRPTPLYSFAVNPSDEAEEFMDKVREVTRQVAA